MGESVIDLSEYTERTRSLEYVIKEAWLEDGNGKCSNSFEMGSSVKICYRFKSSKSIYNPGFGFGVDDMHGKRLFSANNYIMTENSTAINSAQEGIVKCTFPSVPLQPGSYFVSIAIVEDQRVIIDYIERIMEFRIEAVDVFKSGKTFDSSQGIIFVPAKIVLE
ncbi:MAG: Wzt carbohydrate-binding domain-containing protein [Deltaproteobacteria bacterium]|nr:Wzt carbohydrate-binding domain-containing protein [Deltaproteobacteria bacterium]